MALSDRLVERAVLRLARWRNGMSLGVRAAVLRHGDGPGDSEVLLVRHSYLPGWQLPGGGVEAGESAHAAIVRELAEEAAVRPDEPPALFGLYRNPAGAARDHVALFVLRRFTQDAAPRRNWEIRERGFFPVAALPDGTTRATRSRLDEIASGRTPAHDW